MGPGTLYRNYPTREALVLAVYQIDIDRLIESVPGLLEAGQRDGTIRDDADPRDFLQLTGEPHPGRKTDPRPCSG